MIRIVVPGSARFTASWIDSPSLTTITTSVAGPATAFMLPLLIAAAACSACSPPALKPPS